jgi:hypothetical protein
MTLTAQREVDAIFFGIMSAIFITLCTLQESFTWGLFMLSCATLCWLKMYRHIAYLRWQDSAYQAIDRIMDMAINEKYRDHPIFIRAAEAAMAACRWIEHEHPR